METKSGKPPSEIQIQIKVGGNTYPSKDKIKAKGFSFDGRDKAWVNKTTLAEAIEISKKLVFSGVDFGKQGCCLSIDPENKLDGKDVYFFDSEYISPIWCHPGKTIFAEIEKRGYAIYPFLNHLSYTLTDDGKVQLLQDELRIFGEKIEKYKNENPGKYPEVEVA